MISRWYNLYFNFMFLVLLDILRNVFVTSPVITCFIMCLHYINLQLHWLNLYDLLLILPYPNSLLLLPSFSSCGLWVLLHSLSVRVDDGESQFAFTAICDFIHNFFICEECRQHFHEMCSRCTNHLNSASQPELNVLFYLLNPPDPIPFPSNDSVSSPFKTSKDFALWLWTTHNKVNSRLMKDEASLGTGDPKFPKIIWPPKQLCPSCHRSNAGRQDDTSQIDWAHDEVFKFLTQYYGTTLISLYKSKDVPQSEATGGTIDDSSSPTNAVVVPVGAALAIALASCAFGALACYWRSQQKNRKYYHQLHSLKNIWFLSYSQWAESFW